MENESNGAPVLKRLEYSKHENIANETKYYIGSQLSVERFHEYQILELEVKTGMNIRDVGVKMAEIWQMFNKNQIANGLVEYYKLMEGVELIERREAALFRIATLYINTEGEDVGTIDEDVISRKIADWAEYDANDFFTLALSSVNGFMDNYNALLQAISPKENGAA